MAALDGIEARFHRIMWKRLYISKGGRIALIESTLASLPINFMFLFLIPEVVRMRIEQKFKETFVGWWPLERKPHLVKWKTVCIDKRKGDLGIKDLVKFDNALLEIGVGGLGMKRKLCGTK